MFLRKMMAVVLALVALFTVSLAQKSEAPVIPGDFADPSVIRVGDTYYAAGTSSEWAPHFPLYQSDDLMHWKQLGYAFRQTPAWIAGSFWAPELFYRNDTYYLYYTARKKSDGISCIGVATSKDPASGFTDHGILLEFGKEAIDAFVLEDEGKLYISWKAYGLDKRPIELLGSQLSDDGLKVEGEPFFLLRDDEKRGMEGQCIIKRNGYYYLFYSPGDCCGAKCSYQIAVARASSLKGPYTKFEKNPLLAETNEWKCTGHGTIVSTADGKDFYLYHAYNKTSDVYTGRQAMLGELEWDKQTGWPSVHPLPNNTVVKSFKDDFSSTTLSDTWQWDFRNTKPAWKIESGNLSLSGETMQEYAAGVALTVRPFSGNYEITTEVQNRNAALKGLVLYGDVDQALGIGVVNNTITIWEEHDKQRKVMKELRIKTASPVQLKMKVEQGYQCRFYWKNNGTAWREITTGNSYYNGEFLPPWDRSPRPGLLYKGAAADKAVFSFFEIRYE